MNTHQNNSMKIALLTAGGSFILFVFAIAFVLGGGIDLSNILAYLITSLVFGGAAAILSRFPQRTGLLVYLVILGVAFAYMIFTFTQDLGGWADLAGLISLFMIAAFGLVVGLVIALIQYVIHRRRN